MAVDQSTIQARLEAAQRREQEARALSARLRREMATADRRRETQRLCVLGRALEAWARQDDRVAAAARRWLASYVTRDTDRAALAGSQWAPASHDTARASPPGDAGHV